MLYQLQALPIILSVFVLQLAKLSVMQLAFFLLMFFPSGKSQYFLYNRISYEPPVIFQKLLINKEYTVSI